MDLDRRNPAPQRAEQQRNDQYHRFASKIREVTAASRAAAPVSGALLRARQLPQAESPPSQGLSDIGVRVLPAEDVLTTAGVFRSPPQMSAHLGRVHRFRSSRTSSRGILDSGKFQLAREDG